MKYVEEINLSFASGAYNNYQYRLNSLYDPNSSGGGHQPYLFDTMMQLYNIYVVYGALVEVTLSAVTPNVPMKVAMQASIEAGLPTNINLIEEQPDSVNAVINGATNNVVLRKYYDLAKLWGVSKDTLLAESSYQGTDATTPTAPCFLNILARPISSTATSYLQGSIKLKLYTYFKQNIPQAES